MVALDELRDGYPGDAFAAARFCPICSGESRVHHPAVNIHPDKPYRFDLRVCRRCEHGWIDPMPTQGLLNHLYGVGSRSVIGEWGPGELTVPEGVCSKRELRRPPGRYLELGVGQGHLYRLFVERGWHCTGVDPGDWSSRFPNVLRDLNQVPPDLSADVVAAFDVLEHVAEPVTILQSLRRRTAAGGLLYCATPNRLSLRASWDRERWRMVRPVGHVHYYSRQSIKLAFRAAGFGVRWMRATDLFEPRFPRRRDEVVPALVELLGLGDQWIVVAEACPALSSEASASQRL